MWARIESNRVAEITETDPTDRFHPSVMWLECSDNVSHGHLLDGTTFTKPDPVVTPDLASATQRKVVEVLKGMGAWSDYRAYIHSDPDRYDAFYLSQEIRIDDPFVQDAIADPDFPLTAEQAQQIINEANGVD